MAKEDVFLRLLQAHAQLKSSATERREVESLIVSFLRQDCDTIDFRAPSPEDEKAEAGEYVQDALFPPEEDA